MKRQIQQIVVAIAASTQLSCPLLRRLIQWGIFLMGHLLHIKHRRICHEITILTYRQSP